MFNHDDLRLWRDRLRCGFCDDRIGRRHFTSAPHHRGNHALSDSVRLEFFERRGIDRKDGSIDFNEREEDLFTQTCARQLNDIANGQRFGARGKER
jgi:hypothetical protein